MAGSSAMSKHFRHIAVLTLLAFVTMTTNLVAFAGQLVPDEPVVIVTQIDCHGDTVPVNEEPGEPCPDALSPCQICAIVAGLALTERISIHEGFSALPPASLTGLASEAEPRPPKSILL